jgi:predicted Fe-Mo cluster-binding NifX family protein
MILIISSTQPESDKPVEHRFGRSPWLLKVDTQSSKWESFANPGANQSGGAGVAAAQYVIDLKADAVISGDFGPNAANAFRAGNVKMYLFSDEILTPQQAADVLLNGKLTQFK